MEVVWWVLALTGAVSIGVMAGWSLRRAVVTWCRACGQSVGRECIECRDRMRSRNLRAANGEPVRDGMAAGHHQRVIA